MSEHVRASVDDDLIYPEADGAPVGETEIHVDELLALRSALKGRFEGRPDVYVGANMFLYYERGVPSACLCPDLFVVLGVPKRVRRTYKIWEEGKPPDFVLELSSRSTSTEDEGNKKVVCRRLGVREYFLFDPEGEYLAPRFQGFRLRGRDYVRLPEDEEGGITSEVLGIRFVPEGVRLRPIDLATGEVLLRPEEERRERLLAQRRADAAERELAELRRRLENGDE